MLVAILVILIFLWLLGYISLPGIVIPNITFFVINGQPITLWNILMFAVIVWLIGILPRPFREIAAVVFLLWILSTLGILAIAGLPSLLVGAIILGLIVYLLSGI